MRSNNGITLISVAVAVIVILILVGISAEEFFENEGAIDSTKNNLNYYEEERNLVENEQEELKNYLINR